MGLISDTCPWCQGELRLEQSALVDALELRCPDCGVTVDLAPDEPSARLEVLAAA